MQEHAILLGGFESVYLQRLALYFGSRLGHTVQIGIAKKPEPDEPAGEKTVWIGSEDFVRRIRETRENAQVIILTEEERDEEFCVYRYQSCEKLYQKIMLLYWQMNGRLQKQTTAMKQRWMVFTTASSVSALLAASVTAAGILSESAGVLYLNLSECSGMEEQFLLDCGTDLTDLAMALKKQGEICLEAYTRRLETIDYIMPPANPMILHELRETEVERLIGEILRHEEYRYVVVALGSSCCGCDRFLRTASRVFHLADKSPLLQCGHQAWLGFLRLCMGSGQLPIEEIELPEIPVQGNGLHLLREWQEGSLGQRLRLYLEEEKLT